MPKSEYEITLPLPPAGGVILRYPILDEVQAGRDSNLNLLFGFESPEPFSEYLYALHVELVTDASDRIDLGDFVLALPGAIDRRGFALPENNRWLTYLEDEYSYPQDRLVQTWCYRRNLDLVRRLIAHPGGRAEEVAALENVRPASGWPRFVDPRSPREAIDELLSTGLDDPSLAVFAASQTGDAELVTRTRERAVAVLLREVREWMGEGGSSLAVRVAREALTLEPSPDVKRLLLEAEAQFRAFEQEQEALTSGP